MFLEGKMIMRHSALQISDIVEIAIKDSMMSYYHAVPLIKYAAVSLTAQDICFFKSVSS